MDFRAVVTGPILAEQLTEYEYIILKIMESDGSIKTSRFIRIPSIATFILKVLQNCKEQAKSISKVQFSSLGSKKGSVSFPVQ